MNWLLVYLLAILWGTGFLLGYAVAKFRSL